MNEIISGSFQQLTYFSMIIRLKKTTSIKFKRMRKLNEHQMDTSDIPTSNASMRGDHIMTVRWHSDEAGI